ncbi:aldo/keto reductase [Micromonospora noduli]|uniref:aldo/keto reductase n=1 Tax=Micromonospora noduli TaxID=709876 RepID=UPI001C659886
MLLSEAYLAAPNFRSYRALPDLRPSDRVACVGVRAGTANFSTSNAGAGPEASRQIFDAFVTAGGTTIDTSNLYQDGQAETLLGRLLGSQRDDFVIITKYSGTRQPQPALARPATAERSWSGPSKRVCVA